MSDLVLTIESDEEEGLKPIERLSDRERNEAQSLKKQQKKKKVKDEDEGLTIEINPGFSFDGLGVDFDPILHGSNRSSQLLDLEIEDPIDRFRKKNAPPRVSIDEIILRHRQSNKDLPEVELEDWNDDSENEADRVDGSESSIAAELEDTNDEKIEEDSDSKSTSGLECDDSDGGEEEEDLVAESDDTQSGEEDLEKDTDLGREQAVDLFFDGTNVPFDEATTEELAKDTHETPFTSLPGSSRLSRPILLGLASMSITTPTTIQRQSIPLALMGKDMVCSSVTGSGKTLGYMVPILERLIWRDKKGGGRTRVMVLAPTRELAVQVYQVGKLLARYTDITFSLCVGGMNLRAQEVELRERPEIVIGTPGRLIDHVRNTHGFSLETLEILVIDEADRILEEGFHDELEEIISHCPRSRQTLLFSATVTESVADLARLSLDKPVRIKIDPPKSTAVGLTQEFLRIREDPSRKNSSKSSDLTRQAVLIALCKTSSFGKSRTIIFFRSKAGAHRMKIIFSLFSLKAEELHGDLTQEQRLKSLQKFKDGEVSYLLATDLASRGLDIKGVERVINYESPNQYDVYLHRIGRTARAGEKGCSLTLVGESDRKLVKEARKNCSAVKGAIKQRKIDPNLVTAVKKELEKISSSVSEILKEEHEEKELRKSEMELKKGVNLLEHEDEIKGRPARTWFQSNADKNKAKGTKAHNSVFSTKATVEPESATKKTIKRDRFDGLSRKQKRRKMALEEIKEADGRGQSSSINSSIRAAKKAQRPTRINSTMSNDEDSHQHRSKKKTLKKDKKSKGKSSFSIDLGAKQKSLGKSSTTSTGVDGKMKSKRSSDKSSLKHKSVDKNVKNNKRK
ncbi:P-loop containing nucleoside triphosphate hydrolase protein [Phakopsora pachyrhizi]|nr:P-loop containing nucleoside triphosphate hydrolase protein [Phakopsora pachyrhizi]